MAGLKDYVDKFREEEAINLVNHSFSDNKLMEEERQEYDIADNEVLYRGKTNSYISLGGDRYAGKGSGLGTTPDGNFSAVDIVAGSLGNKAIRVINGQKMYAGKNFDKDASRVYISHKSEIDKYLGIPKIYVNLGSNKKLDDSTGKAGIAIVSDCVRILGRNSIKIVTRHLGKDSTDKTPVPAGIDIIAGFDDLMSSGMVQPMVKGDNLIACLEKIISEIKTMRRFIYKRFQMQDELNRVLAAHTHQTGQVGAPTNVMAGNDTFMQNINSTISMFENACQSHQRSLDSIGEIYFSPARTNKYINSLWNRTN